MDKPDWEGFGKAVMAEWPNSGMDGLDLQDIAEDFGVLVKEHRTEFCGEDNCGCREYFGEEESAHGFNCYRKAWLGEE